MTRMLIENVRVMEPGEGVIGSAVLIDGGCITAIDPAETREDVERVDGGGRLLTPGLIDVHVHGIGHHLFEQGPDALRAGLAELPRYGVTCVAPTLYRVMSPQHLSRLAELAEAADASQGAQVPGFHLEGPFLALPGAGAATMPGDVALLEDLLTAMGGRVAAMSISPDTPHILGVIERLAERGVAVFITHTRASVAQTESAIEAGARHATHFYDVFPVPEQTEPGVRPCGAVEVVLADERVTVDFIADGVHVDPSAIRMALACKGPQGVALITDANIGAGLPDGVYESPWGMVIRNRQGDAARIDAPGTDRHGVLAGSALTMDRGVSNLLHWLDVPEREVWRMASQTPARILGLSGKGTLRHGADADVVLWDERGDERHVRQTWVAGRCVYDAASQPREVSA